MNLGGAELLILLAVAAVIFGGSWLPKAARNLGRAKVELDKTQKQLADTKQQVVEATGITHIESTMRKANKALSSSPQSLLKDAARSAVTPAQTTAKSDADADADGPDQTGTGEAGTDDIVDAEIIAHKAAGNSEATVNVDFSD